MNRSHTISCQECLIKSKLSSVVPDLPSQSCERLSRDRSDKRALSIHLERKGVEISNRLDPIATKMSVEVASENFTYRADVENSWWWTGRWIIQCFPFFSLFFLVPPWVQLSTRCRVRFRFVRPKSTLFAAFAIATVPLGCSVFRNFCTAAPITGPYDKKK